MKIAVGSQNRAKLGACELVFSEAFPTSKLELHGYDVESGVSSMPMSNDETYKGALNRAKLLKDMVKADYYVGLEGGVHEGPEKAYYLLGWAAIFGANSKSVSSGHSGGVKLPEEITALLKQGVELGPLIQEWLSDTSNEIRHNDGTNGVLTAGLYPRTREFEDAIRCALGPLL